MDSYRPRYKPSKKPAFTTRQAIVGTAAFICFMLAVHGSFGLRPYFAAVSILLAGGAVGLGRSVLGLTESRPPRGRALEIHGDALVQRDQGAVVAEIDLTRPFEYEILDRYDVTDSTFRLHQDGSTLTFCNSDPGGLDVVRDVVQIQWPPPARGAGRSYTPPSY